MCPGPTFDRVYSALKGRLVTGDFGPGDHLEPNAIGSDLFSSLTPVRDVLHRLVGERIVDAPRSDGFRVPSPTEAELRGLYGWRGLLLDLAVRQSLKAGRLPPPAMLASDETRLGEDLGEELLFSLISRRPHLREIEIAIANAGERLGMFLPAERQLFGDAGGEIAQLWHSYRGEDWPMLRRGLGAYHRRRQRSAPELLECAWRIAHNRQIGSV